MLHLLRYFHFFPIRLFLLFLIINYIHILVYYFLSLFLILYLLLWTLKIRIFKIT